MLFRDVITLYTADSDTDDYGESSEVVDGKEVFANKKSIRQSEFYQAESVGMKPEIMFEVRVIDYEDEILLKHETIDYNVIRSYSKNGEIIELICSQHTRGQTVTEIGEGE